MSSPRDPAATSRSQNGLNCEANTQTGNPPEIHLLIHKVKWRGGLRGKVFDSMCIDDELESIVMTANNMTGGRPFVPDRLPTSSSIARSRGAFACGGGGLRYAVAAQCSEQRSQRDQERGCSSMPDQQMRRLLEHALGLKRY